MSILRNGMNEDDIHRVFAAGGQAAVDALPWEPIKHPADGVASDDAKAGGGSKV